MCEHILSKAFFLPTCGVKIPFSVDETMLNNITNHCDRILQVASTFVWKSTKDLFLEDLNVISCFFFPDSFEINVSSNSHTVSSPGENTTLTCECHVKWPVQEVTWEKLQSHQVDHLITCNLSHGRGYTSRHQRQILTNCSQGTTRTFITVPHVTASDSGLYRCLCRGGPGEKETFVIRLTVTDGE